MSRASESKVGENTSANTILLVSLETLLRDSQRMPDRRRALAHAAANTASGFVAVTAKYLDRARTPMVPLTTQPPPGAVRTRSRVLRPATVVAVTRMRRPTPAGRSQESAALSPIFLAGLTLKATEFSLIVSVPISGAKR